MADTHESNDMPAGTAALEHLTGPSRGTVTWFSGSALDICLGANNFVRVSAARPGEPRADLVARLHRADDSYEIEAIEGWPIWVNGARVAARELKHRDTIEFGESGPMSRFRLYRDSMPARTTLGDIASDALAYLRASRQPAARRFYRAGGQVLRRLARQTTILFRVGMILAIVVLAVLLYQQNRMNTLLQQRVESGAQRLEGFAGALARAKQEALTPKDLQSLRQELRGQVSSNVERLAALERRSLAAGRVISESKARCSSCRAPTRFATAKAGGCCVTRSTRRGDR